MNSKLWSKPVFGWAMYDFANSAFATSVLSVIFNVYFATVLVPASGIQLFGHAVPGESLWGYLISSVMAAVIVLSPLLGAVADRNHAKRALLLLWATIGGLSTMALFRAVPGALRSAMLWTFLATLSFEMSLIFYNALLNDVAEEDNTGRVSGFGFALGYIGGGLCLALNMAMISRPALFHLAALDKTLAVRASVFVAGLWWLAFSLPTFLWVREKKQGVKEPMGSLAQLKQTFRRVLGMRDLRRFLLAFLIFDDGIQTVLLMAAIFGAKALGMSTAQLALCYLMIQFVAFIGAIFFGRLADLWSHKKVVLTTLAIYAGVIIWGVVMRNVWEFWILGVVVGLILGGSQAASRSLYARLIPSAQSGEFFSLYAVVGKAAALVGPFVFGVVSQFYGLRAGVGSLLIFFVLGGAILCTVDEARGFQVRSAPSPS